MTSRNPVRRGARVCVVAAGLLVAVLPATPARAATILVTIPHDTGATNDGECSLREAIMSADYNFHKFEGMGNECASGSGNDLIELPTDTYPLTIGDFFLDPEPVPGTGDLDIFEEIMVGSTLAEGVPVLTINGNGSVVDAGGLEHCCGIPAPDRVFHVHGVSTVINDLTIQGGGGFFDITGDGEGPNIVNQGGGIKVEADPPPGPHVGEGGELFLNRSIVRGNVATEGGGIYNNGGHVSLEDDTVVGGESQTDANFALEYGGGIYTLGENAPSTLVVDGSSVEGNAARFDGGGIYNEFDTVEITDDSNVSSNTAGMLPGDDAPSGGNGGGVWSRTQALSEGEEPQSLYSNDFSGTIGSEWSGSNVEFSPTIVTSPSGERYLGSSDPSFPEGGTGGQPLSEERVTLSLSSLPVHSRIRVSFTFYAIRSWDGSECGGGGCSPDTLDFNVGSDEDPAATTFSNVSSFQAYPGSGTGADFPPGTGSRTNSHLGYGSCCEEVEDTVYEIKYSFEHSAANLDLSWLVGGAGWEDWDNEGWGLDNVVVSIPPGSGLFIDRSQVDGNEALECVGCDRGGTGYGGGIHNVGHAEITGDSLVGPDNTADDEGGGIWTGVEQVQNGETLILQDSTVSENNAGTSGGGIYNEQDTVTVDRSTISDNTAEDGDGGGIWTEGFLRFSATNTTITGNSAEDIPDEPGGSGGGIYLNHGSFELHFVTLADNRADISGGNLGIGNTEPSTAFLDNTIIAGGIPENCEMDSTGNIDSLGFNLSDRSTDGDPTSRTSCQLDNGSDIIGQNPLLGALQDNGGFTETRALSSGSPAIDSAGTTCVETDQRGVMRPQDGNGDGTPRCDRGAYEFVGQPPEEERPPTPTPTPTPAPLCDITGTSGPDVLIGTPAGETICGLGEDDIIHGAGGNDTIHGNEGDDLLDGGPGDDKVNGDAGTDIADYSQNPTPIDGDLRAGVVNGASVDTVSGIENVIGSAFDDVIKGNAVANRLLGLGGDDMLGGRAEADTLRGGDGKDVLRGGSATDVVRGGRDDDRVNGWNGNDLVTGGQGDDRVKGGKDEDLLKGGAGSDDLDGDEGKDECKGGGGKNTFIRCET
jgi:hypothetical protein